MSDTTITAPPIGDGLVRTLGDVAAIAAEAGLRDAWSSPHRWVSDRVHMHCWPSMAFQVVVYARNADGTDAWSAIFDYEAPAELIAHTVRVAQGGAR